MFSFILAFAYLDIIKTFVLWAFILASVLMIFFILLQESKGGGLAGLSGTKAAGVEGVTNPIRRFTAYLAFIWFLLAIVLGVMARQTQQSSTSLVKPLSEEEDAQAAKEEKTATGKAAGALNRPAPPQAPGLAVPAEGQKTEPSGQSTGERGAVPPAPAAVPAAPPAPAAAPAAPPAPAVAPAVPPAPAAAPAPTPPPVVEKKTGP